MFTIGKCLYLSGLTPEQMTADDDYKLLQVGIGFTNMVARATKGSADLTRKEIKEGMLVLFQYQINYMYRRHFYLISAVY
jgi:TDG/mug DNA glycosylase family protein